MIAVITGSNGFIGSGLARRLLSEGAEVRCLVRSNAADSDDGIQRYAIDYAEPNSLKRSGAFDDADYVFHVAGVTKALSLEDFRKGNVMPTLHLLDAARERSPDLKRFILVSSQAAAGPAPSNETPLTESISPMPVEDYGRSKLEAENLLTEKEHPFSYSIVRPAAVYGPRDIDFFNLFRQLKVGAGIYPGNRDSYVSLIHVEDLIDGVLLVAGSEAAENQTYYLAHEESVSWQEIYRAAAQAMERRIVEANLPLPLLTAVGKLGDVFTRMTGKITVLNSNKIDMARQRYWVCSSEKARKELGFEPRIAMHQGFKQTLAWYRMQGWL